ncbi:MAG: sulfite exporter TauE/SafE family protein [Synechococcales cyanobacterium RM1_1_8]|nr:sulfite exporter TauE/SafE family protein [Synechococcales cyanobacterium RM1_1_8]
MVLLLLAIASFASWLLSMLAGAGSPMVLIPLLTWICGANAVAPVLSLGMLLGNGQRVLMFWSLIDWRLTCWYLPGAIAGAITGAYWLSRMELAWLHWAIALALLAMALDHWRNGRISQAAEAKLALLPSPAKVSPAKVSPAKVSPAKTSRKLAAWAFLPLALLNGIGSALIGSTGPILNPAYFGYGLIKEDLIATKAFHNAALHLVKLAAYVYFGSFTQAHLSYGLVIGAAALPGNWLGQKLLRRMTIPQFKQWAFGFVALSGLLMLGQQAALAL